MDKFRGVSFNTEIEFQQTSFWCLFKVSTPESVIPSQRAKELDEESND